MYLVYVDESGTPDKSDNSENFILAGFIINERSWRQLDDEINKAKKTFFPDIHDLEIHTVDIVHGHRQFKGIDVKLRISFLDKLARILERATINTFVIVMRKKFIVNDSIILNSGYEYLYERIAWNLKYLNNIRSISGADQEAAIIFFDGREDDCILHTIRTKVRNLILKGSSYDHNRMIIEDPIFTNSRWRGNIQVADLIAYTFNHKHRAKPIGHVGLREKLDELCSIFEDKMIQPPGISPAYCYKIWP